MRRALAEDFALVPGLRVRMTLDERLDAEPGPWEVVRLGRDGLGPLAGQAHYTLCVAPETDGILHDHARALRGPATSIGSTPGAIALAADKMALARHWTRRGLPTPPARAIDLDGPALPTIDYPAVLKPLDGAGSVDTLLLTGPDDLPPSGSFPRPMLVQPFVPGVPMSASFLIDGDGRASLVGVARQRVAIEAGRFHYLGGVVSAAIACDEARAAVESVPGLKGWVGVDFVRDEATGRITLLELNPRVTTSYVGLRRLYPPGELARAWMAGIGLGVDFGPRGPTPLPSPSSVRFDADGTVHAEALP